MDACLTQTAPTPAASAATPAGAAPDWIRRAVVATIVVGLAWRAIRYLGQFPIWGDEAMLLLNILDRDYAGLTQHLRFAQVAPLFFLWLEKTAILLFGASEWSVHLFPFLAGLVAFVAFWRTCRTSLAPTAAGLAVAILAVSYYPVRHACEVKPYAFDLCFAVIYLWMTVNHLRTNKPIPLTPGPHPTPGRREENRWLLGLLAVTPLAVFSAYPSVFVAGSASLVLLPTMRTASYTQRGVFVTFNAVLIASFLVHYGMVGHHQIDAEEAQRTREFLRTYWKDAFPPDDWTQSPLWLLKVFTGNMLAYPIGANHGGSTLTFLLVLLGSIKLWRGGRRSLLALCWFPFALNLLAAILNKYPFGDSARITLHLAPFICILMAYGLAQTLEWFRAPQWRKCVHLGFYAVLLACGLAGIVRDVIRPYKTDHDRDVRQLARDIARQVGAEDPVLLAHSRDEELLAEFLWNLRVERLNLRWQTVGVAADTLSYWLVQCSNEVPGPPAPMTGWKVVEREVRMVPPENKVMLPMYCQWTRMVRR